jgi:hypothetical protein
VAENLASPSAASTGASLEGIPGGSVTTGERLDRNEVWPNYVGLGMVDEVALRPQLRLAALPCSARA